MQLVRCQSGHFYDTEKYQSCPHCMGESEDAGNDVTVPKVSNTMQDDIVTSKMNQVEPVVVSPTVDLSRSKSDSSLSSKLQETKTSPSDDDKTIGAFKKTLGSDSGYEPVVGWLVCTVGAHYGEDFRLRAGRNFIGRASDMDVCLKRDSAISREKHMIILYEPKANLFMVQPGDSKELSYLNDEVILEAKVIKPYDVILVGESQLTFIPFCSDKYKWAEKDKEESNK